jgi:acid phosphatase family membrane protein YuiD
MTGHVSFSNTGSTVGDNVGLVAALIAVVVAQVLKPFSAWAITGRFKASLMVGSGGFPSSHSSLVTALATGTACQAGLGDPAFATALVLALVVRPPSVNTLPLFYRCHPPLRP